MTAHPVRPARRSSPCRPAAALALLLAACVGDADARAPHRAAAAPPATAAPPNAVAAHAAPRWEAPVRAAALPAPLSPDAPHRMVDLARAGGQVHALVTTGPVGGVATALYHVRLDGGAAPSRLAEGPDWFARMAVDPAGHPHALWFAPERNGQGATVLLHRAWNGQAWGAAEVVYRSESGGGGPMASLAATFACDGALHVAYSTAAGLEHRRWTAGAGWGRPFLLAYAGLTPAWSRGSCPAALHLAWMAGAEGPRRGRSVNQLFVRTFHDGEWGQTTRLFAWPERYSHHPQLVTDGAGRLHALWLQDTDGSILPEAVYHATSCDGRRWTPARDVTPPGVAGARLWGMRAAVDGDGRPHLALRYSRPDRPRVGELATARWEGGAWSLPAPVPADGPLGEGDPLIVAGPARGILAAWRGGDGLYRYAVASAGAARAHPPRSP